MKRALAALFACAACQPSPTVDEQAAEIVGGMVDLGDDAVVALAPRARPCADAPQAVCTGTLVAPRAVLTAAHCVAGESVATLLVVRGPRVDGGTRVEIDTIDIHPNYDGVFADLAVLALAEPLDTPPLPLRRTPIEGAELGGAVRIVGYGVAEDGLHSSKRQGVARIAEISDAAIVLAPDPALPCSADSGGPVLLRDEIAGVVAFGDPACAISGTSTRVDVHVDTFIAPALARIAMSAPASRPPLSSDAPTCTACERAEDCPRGTACHDGVCAVSFERGALGRACTDDHACGSAPCVAGLDETACRCLTPCTDSGGSGCQTTNASGDALVVVVVPFFARRRRRSPSGNRTLRSPATRVQSAHAAACPRRRQDCVDARLDRGATG